MATEDIASGQWTVIGNKMPEANFPTNSDGGKPRHGTVLPVTRAQYQKVLEAYAPAVAVKSVDALSAETTVGVAPTLPETAHLTHADGSVSDVAVEWDAIDASFYAKTGTFTVKGITQDDSRMPVEATVIVNGIDLSKATVTVEPNEFTADGAAKEPAVTVVLDGATLKEGADYTVAYTNNVEPGTATVTVTGAGKYSGTVSATFTIKAAEPGSTLDKSKLQALVDKVKGYNKADYQSGWDAFAVALADAQQVLQNSTDQQEVDKALSRLQSAVDKLVKKSGDSGKTDGKDDGTQKPAAKRSVQHRRLGVRCGYHRGHTARRRRRRLRLPQAPRLNCLQRRPSPFWMSRAVKQAAYWIVCFMARPHQRGVSHVRPTTLSDA